MLPKENRLTEKSDFENVRQNGKFITTPLFSISFVKRVGASRFGFIVSKKVSMKAHERNYVKRILREFFRKNLDSVKPGYDFLIITKPRILHASNDTIETNLKNVIKNI